MTPILPLALTGAALAAGADFLNKRKQALGGHQSLVTQLAPVLAPIAPSDVAASTGIETCCGSVTRHSPLATRHPSA